MLISDRDIRQEIADGRIVLEPYDESMIQPASVDVRIDRFFRLFDNHKYPHIDPAQQQEDLTRLVEVAPNEPFILHPGEFVLGSTYEKVTLPDDVAARLEVLAGPSGSVDPLDGRFYRSRFFGPRDAGAVEYGDFADYAVAGFEGGAAVLLPPEQPD